MRLRDISAPLLPGMPVWPGDTPTRYADIDRATSMLADIMAAGAWDRPQYRRRAAVT